MCKFIDYFVLFSLLSKQLTSWKEVFDDFRRLSENGRKYAGAISDDCRFQAISSWAMFGFLDFFFLARGGGFLIISIQTFSL